MPSLDAITRLKAQGYAVTSRRHRLVSRIDRPDWKEHMAALRVAGWPDQEKALEDARKWVRMLGPHGAADFYRRVHSKDTRTVPQSYLPLMFKSATGPTEFMDSRSGTLSGGPLPSNLPRSHDEVPHD